MSRNSNARTSSWLDKAAAKPEPLEDMDAPLDFSSKKRRSPDIADDTASEGGASSTSSCHRAESPPASMVSASGAMNPLLRFNGMGNYFANVSSHGMPNFPFAQNLTEPRAKGGNKPVRPFKAYPRDPLSLPLGLYGLPMNLGLTPAGMLESLSPDLFNGSKDMFAQYKIGPGAQKKSPPSDPHAATTPPTTKSRKVKHTDTLVTSSVKVSKNDNHPSPSSMVSGSPNATVDSTASTTASSPLRNGKEDSEEKTPEPGSEEDGKGKKRARSVPDDNKDDAYWERRRKNNEAAKRSRDARRAKEDNIALRAAFLEQENMRLRMQVTAMKSEIDKLHCMLVT
ncbi:protein giant-like [Paramacrobiotus metropolitanus]|uniref:protein giant-like n=1 Tax=Paramacrobiotus metropolitanus TaxID=2943436 RepID=UPI002445E491|nr:protein giant-like [Paramacrobiotus metropolitanus]